MAFRGVALQLYTVREPAKQDLQGTLRRARAMGWRYVQWSGMPELGAEAIRAALDDAGLEALAAHIDVCAFEQDYAKNAAFWRTVGALDLAPGGMMADCRDALEDWLAGCRRLDALGKRLKDDGFRLSYHNHDFELGFFDNDPRRKLDILYEETDPAHVYAELDLAWLEVGGVSPAEYLRKYAGRCPIIHAKDLGAQPRDGRPWFTPLGQGVLDWPDVFAACRQAGVEWITYEQDTCGGDPLEDAAVSLAFLNDHV